jgi:hypothetical protein
MKTLYAALAFVFISLIAFHCQKEVKTIGGNNQVPGNGNNTITASPVNSSLQGNVWDENGKPASDVSIKVGTVLTTTDDKGYFRVDNASLDKNASLVTAIKAGYFKAYRSFSATSGVNQVMIRLIKKNSAGVIKSDAGGQVTLSNGSVIALPANGIVRSGAAYNGNVNVYASYIDPVAAEIGERVPGSFMAIDKNNKLVTLSSYGMLAVDLESATGEKLQLANGSTATLTIPVPASIQSSAPASIPLWYLDEQTGIWKEEGTAVKNGNAYTGTVKHFSYWNADVSVPTVGFTATLKTPGGEPLTSTYVRFRAANGYVGNAYGVTDSLGQVSGFIPSNMNLVMEVLNSCHGIAYSQNVGPFSSAVNLGTITINNSVSLITIKGKLSGCSNGVVANGHALIKFDNIVRNVDANSSGEFSVTFTICSFAPATCEITGYDDAAAQQGSTSNVTVTTPVTDAGTLNACGISTVQFINYTLDGTNYSLSSAASDSLLAYTSTPGIVLPVKMWIMGSRNPDKYVNLTFGSNTATGTYPMNGRMYINNYGRIGVIEPFNVIITSFPQAAGGYFEGSFTGQFKDTANLSVVHDINATFRLARNW